MQNIFDFLIPSDKSPPPQYEESPLSKLLKQEKPKPLSRKPTVEKPKGKFYSNGSTAKIKADGEWEIIKPKSDDWDRSNDLTAADIDDIREAHLKVNVAIILKNCWANGCSIGEVEKLRRGERNFSRRNIEKYWAIFNRNNPSPK